MSHRVIPYGIRKFLWQWHCERRYSVYFTFCILLYHINFRLPTELKLLRSTTSFCCQLKTFLFQSAYGHRDTAGGDCFVTCPRSATSGCSTNTAVAVAVRVRFMSWRVTRRFSHCCLWVDSPTTRCRTSSRSRRRRRLSDRNCPENCKTKTLQQPHLLAPHVSDLKWP